VTAITNHQTFRTSLAGAGGPANACRPGRTGTCLLISDNT
jgi:hypothetical protein